LILLNLRDLTKVACWWWGRPRITRGRWN